MNNFQSRPQSETSAIQAALIAHYGYTPLPDQDGFSTWYAAGRSFYVMRGNREIFTNELGQMVWAKRLLFVEPATSRMWRCYAEVVIVMDAKQGNQLVCKGIVNEDEVYSQSWRYVMTARHIGEESSPETALGLVLQGLETIVKKG